MGIIRKKLTPDELMSANTRYNETLNIYEYTPDGVTWYPDPGRDPRTNPIYRLPPLSGTDAQCDSAARIIQLFKNALIIFQNSVNAAQFATAIMSLSLLLTPVAGVLAGIALLLFDVLIDIGQATIEAAFTEAVWEGIECIIVYHSDANGQISLAQRDAIMADIAAVYPGTVYNTLVNVVNLFGEVLMSNAGVEYDDEGDCSDCHECLALSFCTFGNGATLTTARGVYVPGSGWRSTFASGATRVVIRKKCTISTNVDSIAFKVSATVTGTLFWNIQRVSDLVTINSGSFNPTGVNSFFVLFAQDFRGTALPFDDYYINIDMGRNDNSGVYTIHGIGFWVNPGGTNPLHANGSCFPL